MPPKKAPPRTVPQKQQSRSASGTKINSASTSKSDIPEHEVKQSSSMSAQLALEAAKKAYELRQAAYGAGDANAREEILAKAINKEIEAESFGKAAKYTRSGAFQGLAAGAGLGVQPGVTLGNLTGALVGGVVASVGAVLGGGIGSVWGSISGPFWDLGEIASHGVRSVVGDFPNWEATPSQKKALEKMVMGAQQTKAPSRDELEQMRDDEGGGGQEDQQQFISELKSWIPSMPSVPNMPSISSIPGLGGQSKGNENTPARDRTITTTASSQSQQSKASAKADAPPKARTATAAASNQSQQSKASAKCEAPPKAQDASTRASSQSQQIKASAKAEVAPNAQDASRKASSQTLKSPSPPKGDENATKKKPRKLEPRSTAATSQPKAPAVRKAPPKLELRRKAATQNA